MNKFELENQEYIQLNQFLKLLGLVESGSHAKECILDGEVLVNNQTELQLRKKLRKGDTVSFREEVYTIE